MNVFIVFILKYIFIDTRQKHINNKYITIIYVIIVVDVLGFFIFTMIIVFFRLCPWPSCVRRPHRQVLRDMGGGLRREPEVLALRQRRDGRQLLRAVRRRQRAVRRVQHRRLLRVQAGDRGR